MKKYYITLCVVLTVSFASFGQTTQPKLNEVRKDPKTTENAARADVQATDNKKVVDNAQLKTMFSKKRKANARKRKNPFVRTV